MPRAIVVKGRMISPTTIELDEAISEVTGGVEVVLRSVTPDQTGEGETVFELLRHLPPGTRAKEDIDRQIREEREAWGDH
jgi:hypothetical protein